GIRDFHVTGVQTCALPISLTVSDALGLATANEECKLPDVQWSNIRTFAEHKANAKDIGLNTPSNYLYFDFLNRAQQLFRKQPVRSEERRVGKECGARWSGA